MPFLVAADPIIDFKTKSFKWKIQNDSSTSNSNMLEVIGNNNQVGTNVSTMTSKLKSPIHTNHIDNVNGNNKDDALKLQNIIMQFKTNQKSKQPTIELADSQFDKSVLNRNLSIKSNDESIMV